MPALEGTGKGEKNHAVSRRPSKTAFSPTSAKTDLLRPASSIE